MSVAGDTLDHDIIAGSDASDTKNKQESIPKSERWPWVSERISKAISLAKRLDESFGHVIFQPIGGLFMDISRLVQVQPVLPSQDVTRSIAFYVDKLGFSVAFQDSPSHPRYAGIRRDQVAIHLQWHAPDEWDRVERPMLRFVVNATEKLFKEYERSGVFHAETKLRDTPWGTREFAFFDPDMNGLTFYEDL